MYAALDKEAAAKYSDAKAELGLWSTAGVQESRRLFWRSFESGKVFGRRQTFWDALVSRLVKTLNRKILAALLAITCEREISGRRGTFWGALVSCLVEQGKPEVGQEVCDYREGNAFKGRDTEESRGLRIL